MIRLDKYLSDACGLSRSQAKQMIKKGRVEVDGRPELSPERKLDPDGAEVLLDGQLCRYERFLYLMLNKPRGLVSATEDARESTVLDCVDAADIRGHELFPAGRLDKDTEGLLLLTDDGKLAHDLLSPRKHVDKCYYALLDRDPGPDAVRVMREGLDIGDEKKTLPAELTLIGPAGLPDHVQRKAGSLDERVGEGQEGYAVRIVIREGRYHQIKRMAACLGCKVLYLKRERMGPLQLDPGLAPGRYRPLREEELRLISSE